MRVEWDFTHELLTPEEREIALDDMRERTGDITPSLDDCVYIGAVYQQKKSAIKKYLQPTRPLKSAIEIRRVSN